jgi:hypothetical protein
MTNCNRDRREITVYNGQQAVGRIVTRGRDFTAFDVKGSRIGKFADQRSAVRAVIDGAAASHDAR